MKISLPSGWRIVSPAKSDIEKVTAFIVECDTLYFGEPDTTQADVEHEWSRPGFDLTQNAFLLFSDTGEIAGYTDYLFSGEELYITPNTVIHPNHLEKVNCSLFYLLAEEKARDFERVKNIRTISVREESSRVLTEMGYTPIQTQYRMVKDITGELDEPILQEGYDFMPFHPADDAYAVFDVIETAFQELPHRTGNTFEGWQTFIMKRRDFEPALVWTVRKQGEIAGVGIGFDDPIGGWVRQLAVRKEHRGKGIALAILNKAFLEFQKRGRQTVGLTVDSENATGAPQLYLHAGMRQTEKYVTYIKKIK